MVTVMSAFERAFIERESRSNMSTQKIDAQAANAHLLLV